MKSSVHVAAGAILVLLIIGSSMVQAGQQSSRPVRPGVEQATMSFSEIERRDALLPKTTSPMQIPFNLAPRSWTVPAGANILTQPRQGAQGIVLAEPSPATTASFEALLDNGKSIPPDTQGAVGPHHLMVTLNSQVRIMDRFGGVISTVSLGSFWSAFSFAKGVFDPRVTYDPFENRWIHTALSDARTADSALLVAVSKTSDPTGDWQFYRFKLLRPGFWWDFDCLGFNKNWVTISINLRTIKPKESDETFVESDVLAFKKSDLYAFTTPGLDEFDDVGGESVCPAVTYDNTVEEQYLLQTWTGNSGGLGLLRLDKISGTPGSATFTAIAFPASPETWNPFPGVPGNFMPQKGTPTNVEAGEDNTESCCYRNGSIWGTQTIFLPEGDPATDPAAATRASVQWWEIGTAGTVKQRGRIDDPSGATFYAYPSIAANSCNDVLIGYSRFAATQYPSANYSFRGGGDPPNTLREDTVLKAGEDFYAKTFGTGRNRWGDFSSTVVDPLDDRAMWTLQEFAHTHSGGDSLWDTWWGEVCNGVINVCVFNDHNMNGIQDPGETGVEGWPIELVRRTSGGGLETVSDALTGPDGCVRFCTLPEGIYFVLELGGGMTWDQVQTKCGGTTYCDWRTNFDGHNWISTKPSLADTCEPIGTSPGSDGLFISCSEENVTFGNTCLSFLLLSSVHDTNLNGVLDIAGEPFVDFNGNGVWDPAEPFTDLNCNGKWDPGEFFEDTNGNGKWDVGEFFSDEDSDFHFDPPECLIQNWPFTLTGNRADGKPVCIAQKSDITGLLILSDIPPSDASGYTVREDLSYCSVDLPTGTVQRTTYASSPACGPTCEVTRWQATTATEKTFFPTYCSSDTIAFGNVCLARIDGTVSLFSDSPPPKGKPAPGKGIQIDLAGTDHLNRDIVPSKSECTLLPAAAKAPIAIPCITSKWYETVTDDTGHFSFVDLLPGHYHLAQQPNPLYRFSVDKRLLCGFDVLCCPTTANITNTRKDLVFSVSAVNAGGSNGTDRQFLGYKGPQDDSITATPGVLSIVPTKDWDNFKQAGQLCRESPTKNVMLTKTTPRFEQCSEVFHPRTVTQHGTNSIRLWWPLLYESPGTTWTLTVQYGTRTAVQLPGETSPGYFHQDIWKWTLDSDIQQMKLLLDLMHEMPFGSGEMPLISNEALYLNAKSLLEAADAAFLAKNMGTAAMKLSDFELLVSDACTSSVPAQLFPSGPGTGIAQTSENPACCKLLVDVEYVGKKLGVFVSGK